MTKRIKRVIKKSTKEILINALREACPYGDPEFYKIIVDLCELHNDKNSDYASKEAPLSNFINNGRVLADFKLITPGRSATKTSLIYMWKQIAAAYKLVGREEKGNVEGVEKRLDDVAVYAILTKILYGRGL